MNGWRNAETWTVNLWFGDTFAAMAEHGEALSADACREMVEEYAEEALGGAGGFIWDMMNLGAVDWQELAEHHLPVDA